MLNEHTNWVIKNPKSFAGNRTLLVSDTMIGILQNLKKQNKAKNDDDVISIKPSIITNNFSRLLKKLELPHFRFHDLRQQKVNNKAKILLSFLQKIFYFPFDLYAIFFKNIDFINKEVYQFFI